MNLRKSILIRMRIAFVVILIFSGFVVVKAFKLTMLESEEYKELSREQSTRLKEVKAVRGSIYSSDGKLLATSMPRYEIRFDTRASGITDELFNQSVDSLAILCSQFFPKKNQRMWRDYLKSGRRKRERYMLIETDVSYEKAKALSEWPIFRMGKYKGGLIREERNVREMPFVNMGRRTIGFITGEGNKVGLEKAYDSTLSGISGKRLEQRVYGNVWRPIKSGNVFQPKDGNDIVTTLDISIQDVAEDALKRALISSNAQSGCAVLMEVKTGHIKAIANYTRTSSGDYFEAINYAINVASDPGSTFKLASAIALLEENAIDIEDSVNINYGRIKFYDRNMEDAHLSAYKKQTFQYIFEHSSNVGFASLVNETFKSKPDGFIRYLSAMNMDRPLGIEIQEEGNIRVKKPQDKDWYATTLPWLAIGYESRITPLQTLALYNAVANKGKMVKPIFVQKVTKTGRNIQTFEPVVLNEKICSDKTLKKIHDLLVGVVENGTAKNLKNLDYKVAGKTGTAQILMGGRYDKGSHKASFVGYFPAENPQYTCIVVVNAPRGGVYYGGLVAGPVFKEIADKVYASMTELHPELEQQDEISLPIVKSGYRDDIKLVLNKLKISSHTEEGEVDWVGFGGVSGKSIRLKELPIQDGIMPNIKGMGLRDALYLLENMGLKVRVNGYGKIKEQSIQVGAKVRQGDAVYLTLRN